MNSAELFILSEHALTKIVDQITNEQWDLDVPSEISKKGGTIRTVINYHAYDDAFVPDTLAGKTITEVGNKYDGDLLGEDPKASWHAIVEKSIAAVKNCDLDKTVHLSYGDYSASEYLQHITLFRTFRTVDFARFLGFDDSLPEELVIGVMDFVTANEKMLRDYHIIPPALPVAADAPAYEKLMAFIGRQPK